jgi:glucosamine kinase
MRQDDPGSNQRYLGLDVGGSATRWCLIDRSGDVLGRGEVNGFSGHLAQSDVRQSAEQALAAIHLNTGPVVRIVAGVTGLSRKTDAANLLHALLKGRFGADIIDAMPDIELACRSTFREHQGIVVYAGTGSIAAHLRADGELVTAGGKGVLIDDAGGGYWIAVQAIRAILRMEDAQPGSGWATSVGQKIGEMLGGTDWPVVRRAFYALDRGGIGQLAIAVAAAAHDGDGTALRIMRTAGEELAQFAQMLLTRVGHLPVTLVGRAAALHPDIATNMHKTLHKHGFSHEFMCLQLDQALTAAQCCLAAAYSPE